MFAPHWDTGGRVINSPSTDRGSGETYVQAELIDELPSTKLS